MEGSPEPSELTSSSDSLASDIPPRRAPINPYAPITPPSFVLPPSFVPLSAFTPSPGPPVLVSPSQFVTPEMHQPASLSTPQSSFSPPPGFQLPPAYFRPPSPQDFKSSRGSEDTRVAGSEQSEPSEKKKKTVRWSKSAISGGSVSSGSEDSVPLGSFSPPPPPIHPDSYYPSPPSPIHAPPPLRDQPTSLWGQESGWPPSPPLVQQPYSLPMDHGFVQSLRSTLGEFFDPLRTNNPRTDFFSTYRRESEEFDHDYSKMHEDLNPLLIFAGLFSTIAAFFIVGIQPKLEPSPSEVSAAYMQILIHAVDNSLFPDASTDSISWAGPPREIVTVQAILYASLATSLFAAFLATLSKRWLNRYTQNRGGSAAEKSRDRQRKLDGFEEWRFHLIIETLPVLLQISLLLLGIALSTHLWKISRTVAWVVLAFTLCGVISYAWFTIAGAFYSNCPYSTSTSSLILTLTRELARSDSTIFRSLRHCTMFLATRYHHSMWILGQTLVRLRPRVRSALSSLCCIPGAPDDVELAPVPTAAGESSRDSMDILDPQIGIDGDSFPWNSGEIYLDLEVHKADARCVSWILDSTTDEYVVFSAARFTASTVLHPEVANIFSLSTLTKHFLGCISDGRVAPEKLMHMSPVGIALASVLSVQLCVDGERGDLMDITRTLRDQVEWILSPEALVPMGVLVLEIVLRNPEQATDESFKSWGSLLYVIPWLGPAEKLTLSATILQTIWRWRRIQASSTTFNIEAIEPFFRAFMSNGGADIPALKTNCFLIMAISLGGLIKDFRTLFTPTNNEALRAAIDFFHEQLRASIRSGRPNNHVLTSILSALSHLNPFQVMGAAGLGFSWITDILDSAYPFNHRYRMVNQVAHLLEHRFNLTDLDPLDVQPSWILPIVRYVQFCEENFAYFPGCPRSTILYMLSSGPATPDFGTEILPLLTMALSSTHPLGMRRQALKAFRRLMPAWLSSEVGIAPLEKPQSLLEVVDDPFLPLYNTPDGDSMEASVVLIEFASSDMWRPLLRGPNFETCEEFVSDEEGRRVALRCMNDIVENIWPEFLHNASKVAAATGCLEELGCPNIVRLINRWARERGILETADELESLYGDSWGGGFTEEESGRFVGHSATPAEVMDWTCHYPQN